MKIFSGNQQPRKNHSSLTRHQLKQISPQRHQLNHSMIDQSTPNSSEIDKDLLSIIRQKEPLIARQYLQRIPHSPNINSSFSTVTPTSKRVASKPRPATIFLPSLSPDKSIKNAISVRLEDTLKVFHNKLTEVIHRKGSTLTDVEFLGESILPNYSKIRRYSSSRLQQNLVQKSFNLTTPDISKEAYEAEKINHKLFEAKTVAIVDLLAYDDVGLRLFYEDGSATLQQVHNKYKTINVAFSESELLSLLKQLLTGLAEMIAARLFFGSFSDIGAFIFSRQPQSVYMSHVIKCGLLTKSGSNPMAYNFSDNSHHSQQDFFRIQSFQTNLHSEHRDEDKKIQSQQSVSGKEDIDNQIWQKIHINEAAQIGILIQRIFGEQNSQGGKISESTTNKLENEEIMKEYEKLSTYLEALRKCSSIYQIEAVMNELANDSSILDYVIIEETIIDQIKMDQIQSLTSLKKQPEIPSHEEIKSIAMIAIQTINKHMAQQLQVLQTVKFEYSSETQGFYDQLLNYNQIQTFTASSLDIAAQIEDIVLASIDRAINPLSYAEHLLNKALIHFLQKTEGVNCLQLVKIAALIAQRNQGNEISELSGKAYLLMSEIVLKTTNNRARALEYAFFAYDIRKQVHGPQSKTMEFVDSLRQIAKIHELKGQPDQAFKYLEKALNIAEELTHEFHRTVIELLTEQALLTFTMESYNQCLSKCSRITDIYHRCGSSIASYSFPFAMNLYSLSKLRQDNMSVNYKGADANTIKGALKFGLKAANIVGALRGENPNTLEAYISLKNIAGSFQKTFELEENTAQIQQEKRQKSYSVMSKQFPKESRQIRFPGSSKSKNEDSFIEQISKDHPSIYF